MAKLLKLTVNTTATGAQTGVRLQSTPLLGGQNREALLLLPVPPNTAVFKLQGAPIDPATGAIPISGSALWTDIVTINAASDREQRITLPECIRANVTTAEAATTIAYVEGEQ